MYEIAELRDMLTRYKFELSIIAGRYDALSDKCVDGETTDEEDNEFDYLCEKMELLDDCIDAINEMLDKYGFQ